MATSRVRAGHARTKRAGVASRALAALAVVATAASTLVVSQVAAPEAAHAAQEQPSAGINVGPVRANMGTGFVNASATDTTTSLPDNFIRYGIVKAMSDKPADRIRTGSAPTTTFLGGEYAKNNDAWTYIARGWPWKWDENPAKANDSEKWMQAHYEQWKNGGDGTIWVNGQSAIGFKPNDPGTVQPGQTFLLGAIRHNNLPIRGGANVKQFLHSSLNLTLPDLVGSTPENFPFVNQETSNTLATTIIYRKGGAYVKTAGEPGTGTCSSDFGLNGWPATQQIEGKWPRDWLLAGGKYGTPGYTPSGSFIGPAYEPDPVDASDRSKGYVNKPETQSGRMYCVKYVGEGNGEYDLYSQYYNKGAEQPASTLGTNNPEVLPREWPGAKGNVNENPYVWDNVKLTKTTSDQTFTKNGRTYRLQLWGFVPADNPRTLITPENIQNIPTAQCPKTPAPDAKRTDTFITQELSVNYGCLYGVITEERSVRIAKAVEDPAGANPTIPAATFAVETGDTWHDNTDRTPATTGTVTVTKPTASSAPAKTSYISAADPAATLTPTAFGEDQAKYDSVFIPFEVGNSDFTITEKDINTGGEDKWNLKDIKCVNGIGEDVAVTKTERGVNFKNVGGAATNEAAPITCTFVNEYQAPKLRVEKSIEANGGANGATSFNVDYKIVATNDGSLAANTGKLTDKPDFAKGLEIQSAKIAETQAGLDSASNATATNGVYTLTDGVELAPGATKEYWIRFAVVRNPAAAGYNEANLACSVNGNNEFAPGKGLFNEVLAENGKDSDGTSNNKACGPTVPHDFVVVKAGTQNTGKAFADADNQYTSPSGAKLYPLSGAEFAIYNANPNTDANATVVKTLTQATATDGYYWSVNDLNIDTTYWLVETKAPAGHSLLPQPIEFKLTSRATGSGTTVELKGDLTDANKWAKSAVQGFSSEANSLPGDKGFLVAGTRKATIVVKDTEVGELPKAGSTGIYPYIGAAAVLMTGAMVMTVVTTKRRKAIA
ncbi:prealbumin-like fold domain-containing protein [Schaalia odontolytica]|uniref:prealbumin-like fold domain-containing protein n=1 Tax=Schaalia odontolytica TaxID=1660 RepID=UPI00210DE63C|nr:prealbumin-like fold domain-containing protein [Schaalia odontolytica]MCQ5273280.1 prealbumin-like fold domain-containing protein [Schaalia odontolytica]MCQ5281651.1 prealbumin-like fold domain-containing protein [Schaalia odontolytica]